MLRVGRKGASVGGNRGSFAELPQTFYHQSKITEATVVETGGTLLSCKAFDN
jgi:hypothetical protein